MAVAAILVGATACGIDPDGAEGGSTQVATTSPVVPSTDSDPSTPSTPGSAVTTTVDRIVDGDTLYVTDLEERVRLIGIDTPETQHPNQGVECFGREATAHLAEMVPPGTPVRVEFGVERTDRYDRPLGYLFRAQDDLHVNLQMVLDGYATAYTVPPNVRYEDAYVAAQRQAREAGRGLWQACEDASD